MSSRNQRQGGQAIVVIALMIVVLIGVVGLAIDGANAYMQNQAAERAAAAGALAGVLFMPNQKDFATGVPPNSRNNAHDRAVDEAARNGFDSSEVVVDTSGQTQLKVTVTRSVGTFFMPIFGVSRIQVSRTAIAASLAPISIGQPGQQEGCTVSQLSICANPWVAQMEGWEYGRENGDAFTPNPCWEYGSADASCPGSQVGHQISSNAVNEAPPGAVALPSRGGYNWRVTIPPGTGGGTIWVYDAAHAPDYQPTAGHNQCENLLVDTSGNNNNGNGNGDNGNAGATRSLCSGSSSYVYKEDNGPRKSPKGYLTMKYTLFSVPNLFFRGQDKLLSSLTVKPIDATQWNDSSKNYTDPSSNWADPSQRTTINQVYDVSGPCPANAPGGPGPQWIPAGSTCQAPANMQTYHSWIRPDQYAGDGGLAVQALPTTPGWLPEGTYRLRVDAVNGDGSLPPAGSGGIDSRSLKPYSVAVAGKTSLTRVTRPDEKPCGACNISAWNELAMYTPVQGKSFAMPLFQLPAAYAGSTVLVDIFDPGDVGGSQQVTMAVLDDQKQAPSDPGNLVRIYDLGRSQQADPSKAILPCIYTGNTENVPNAPCIIPVDLTGNHTRFVSYDPIKSNYYNGHWVRVEVPIPAGYKGDANGGWWNIEYAAAGDIAAHDALTFKISIKGAPARLITS